MGFFNPISGRVLFTYDNGFFEACTKTREIISYVPQGNTLMAGTIKENLLIGNPSASDEEIIKSIELAGMEEILQWPNGIETEIGEKGTRLSAGQAQRIGMARAFIKKSKLLIIDEAASSLDIMTEIKILTHMKHFIQENTKIIITHREEALQFCDVVLMVSDGGSLRTLTPEQARNEITKE
jgi:ATP-binding cassette, subfamily B, bacterial